MGSLQLCIPVGSHRQYAVNPDRLLLGRGRHGRRRCLLRLRQRPRRPQRHLRCLAMASLSTPVSPPPSATGLPRVFTVSSATTTARGAPSPSTATMATALESTTTTSTLASTATTTPTVCPDAPSLQ